MRRLIAWVAGLAGVAALVRVLRRRGQSTAPTTVPPPADDPAEELRRKLAEARAGATTSEPDHAEKRPTEDEAPRADGTDVEPEGASIEERRADVHARAQAAIESMREEAE